MNGSRGLFVVGTDTDVGKTAVAVAIVTSLVARGVRVGVYKPVASGALGVGGDAHRLWQAAGSPLALDAVCPQSFAAAIAPTEAARAEGREVDEVLVRRGIEPWLAACDVVVVEGAGGLFSPLGPRTLVVDVAREFRLPLVIVDSARLGLVGRTLMACRAARAEGLPVAAVVISQTVAAAADIEGPAGAAAILKAGLATLRERLPEVPVALLAHGAVGIEPELEWRALAGG